MLTSKGKDPFNYVVPVIEKMRDKVSRGSSNVEIDTFKVLLKISNNMNADHG